VVPAKVPAAGQRALVPEAKDSPRRGRRRDGSFLGDDLEAQCHADHGQGRGGQGWNDGQRDPLRDGEVFPGHGFDSIRVPLPYLPVKFFIYQALTLK
jgi:hypothetical protein